LLNSKEGHCCRQTVRISTNFYIRLALISSCICCGSFVGNCEKVVGNCEDVVGNCEDVVASSLEVLALGEMWYAAYA
jgi:hypothetical protein